MTLLTSPPSRTGTVPTVAPPETAADPRPGGTTVVARLDSDGDVLLAGPAVRAVARGSDRVVLLVSPAGRQAAHLLPGVDEVVVYDAPWSGYDPPHPDRVDFDAAIDAIAADIATRGVVLTSFHQSPLPAALMLRLAGVGQVTATSEDYPGSLLSVRHRLPEPADPASGGLHEVRRALATVRAAGFETDSDPYGEALAVLMPPRLSRELGDAVGPPGYVVVHPGASVPARAASPHVVAGWVGALVAAGHRVVVTGSPAERGLTAQVARPGAVDLGGRTTLAELARIMAGASVAVVGNTGPAHLAAAVRTPVVSAFAPVVAWSAWRPWGVSTARLEPSPPDLRPACTGTRARVCPVPGHPCLDTVSADAVVAAVARLTRRDAEGAPR